MTHDIAKRLIFEAFRLSGSGYYRDAINKLREVLPILRTLADEADFEADVQAMRAEIARIEEAEDTYEREHTETNSSDDWDDYSDEERSARHQAWVEAEERLKESSNG